MGNLRFISESILTEISDSIRNVVRGNVKYDPYQNNAIWPVDNNNKLSPNIMANVIRYMNVDGYTSRDGYSGLAVSLGVENMRSKYTSNATFFYPLVFDGVTDIFQCYYNCRLMGGDGMCPDSVGDATGAYRECWNMSGHPAMGDGFRNTGYYSNGILLLVPSSYMYYNCQKLTGNAEIGARCTDLSYAYTLDKSLDGYVNQHIVYREWNDWDGSNNIPKNDFSYGQTITTLFQTFMNCFNLKGGLLTSFENYKNFPFNDVELYPNLVNMNSTFKWCYNLDGRPFVGKNVTDALNCYYECQHIVGDAMSSDKLLTMADMYYNCQCLDGNAACGINVTTMVNCYQNCYNLKYPVVGEKVTTMINCYRNCHNLIGAPQCGPVTTIMTSAYQDCWSIKGTPNIGTKVTTMTDTFHNCYNMTGTADTPTTVTTMANCFRNCDNLGAIIIRGTALNATTMANAFVRSNYSKRLNVIFATSALLTQGKAVGPAGCTMSDVIVENKEVRVPYTYNNGKIYGERIYNTLRYCYNEAYNIYMYALT